MAEAPSFRISVRLSAPIGMAFAGRDGRFLEVNPALCEMLGVTEQALLEQTISALTHPDDIASNQELHDSLYRDEISGYSLEKRFRHADGSWFPVKQTWLEQLPGSYAGRIRHGVRIDPASLVGTAGFYGDADANCCPSQELVVNLTLRSDVLALSKQPLVRPAQK